jgi:hypothetical protein
MNRKSTISLVLTVIICCGGCTNTRYLTDQTSIDRQHDMKTHRVGKNIGEGCLNLSFFIISVILDSQFTPIESERTFKRISIVNLSADSLYVNMVTDIVWKETGYCDIMGIALPPGAKQKLLVPYPAAYNVFFRTPFSEEEKLGIRTDSKLRIINLDPGMTKDSIKSESPGDKSQ